MQPAACIDFEGASSSFFASSLSRGDVSSQLNEVYDSDGVQRMPKRNGYERIAIAFPFISTFGQRYMERMGSP